MDRERQLIIEELSDLEDNSLKTLRPKAPKKSYKFTKCSRDSVSYREKGNTFFRLKKHEAKTHLQILKNYSYGIAFAPKNSNELALSYANRSALLLHLRKYEECIVDIDRALSITDSCDLKVKLLCRKVECQVALQEGKQRGSYERAKYWLNKVEDVASKKKLFYKVRKAEKIMDSNNPDYKVRSKKDYSDLYYEEENIDICYNEEYGRHLVAMSDFSIGDQICIEEFYVTSANGKKNFLYCSHCLAISWATVPCDNCTYAMYCSEKCKEEAWEKYHDFECFMAITSYTYEESHIQLGLRTFIMAYNEAGNIDNLKVMLNDVLKGSDKKKKNFLDIDKFFTNGFKDLFSFTSPKNIQPIFVKCAVNALLNLSSNTDICENNFDLDRNMKLSQNENAIFIATVLLKLITVFSLNAFSVIDPFFECRKKNLDLCKLNLCCPRGFSFSPIASLFNHSCDGNVSKFYTNDGQVVYYALRTIRKGEQLFTNYYCNFITMNTLKRQIFLQNFYEIDCCCIACEEDWKTFKELKSSFCYENVLFRNDKGFDLLLKYQSLIRKIKFHDYRCSFMSVHYFANDLKNMMEMEPKQSINVQFFISVFIHIMEMRYGTVLRVPSKCKGEH